MMGSLIDHLVGFGEIWLATYVLVFGSYLVFGWAFTLWSRHHPERKIQERRDGQKRRNKEIRASARSLIVTCACFAGGLYLQLQGVTLFDPFALTWWSAPLMFLGSVFLFDTWFYWVHRLNHFGPFKKWHALHHQSVAPTVWSNYSDTFFDAFSQQSFFLFMPLIVPFPPAIFIAHRAFDHFNGMIGHSGIEFAAGKSSRSPWPLASVTFHDMHHSTYNYNYANHFSFWDRLMGTLHPDYDEKVVWMEKRIAAGARREDGDEVPSRSAV
ncbi:sterol desaturase family protein [Acuticoccus sp. M5D2P5]|uniref:sterol desaturase family protein n=1 Tax=Acuticoccus kalidii TaxID=2910977 RepID=UPI001F445779|nr:sterol desaturase family protein [Acuticoccus kalidii]MCF3931959.1 sterol desaturase family protein [Acuticoccus kalidii]